MTVLETIMTVDDIKQAIKLQGDEIKACEKALKQANEDNNRLWELYWFKRFGVQIGSEIICKHRGKDAICRVSSYNHDHHWMDRPWFWVNVKTKDGWSKNEVHSYDWRVANADSPSTEERK